MLCMGDEFEFLHPSEHDIALPEGCLEVVERRVTVGAADQSRQKGRLREAHVGCGFSEVGLARRLDPVETGAEVDAVHVELEDLLLGHLHLDAEGHGRLEELAVEGLAAEREAVAGQLLGDRAGPLLHPANEKVPHGRTCDAERVDSAVLVESRVFAADQGLDEIRRDTVVGDHDAVLPHGPAVECPGPVINRRSLRHLTDRREVEGERPEIVENTDKHPEKECREAELDQRDQEGAAAFPWRGCTAAFVRGAGGRHGTCILGGSFHDG